MYAELEDAQKISDTLRDMKSRDVLELLQPKSRSMNKMLVYLGLVESLGATLMNTVLFLLMVNGEQIHTKGSPPKHARSFSELGDLDMVYKLDCLEHADIGFFNKIIRRDIRNRVGHLKFRVHEDGVITDVGGCRIDIDEAISDFWWGVATILLILEEIGFMKWLRAEANKPILNLSTPATVKKKKK